MEHPIAQETAPKKLEDFGFVVVDTSAEISPEARRAAYFAWLNAEWRAP